MILRHDRNFFNAYFGAELFFGLALANLIADGAAGLARGLARGLALAATAALHARLQSRFVDGLNVFHDISSFLKCSPDQIVYVCATTAPTHSGWRTTEIAVPTRSGGALHRQRPTLRQATLAGMSAAPFIVREQPRGRRHERECRRLPSSLATNLAAGDTGGNAGGSLQSSATNFAAGAVDAGWEPRPLSGRCRHGWARRRRPFNNHGQNRLYQSSRQISRRRSTNVTTINPSSVANSIARSKFTPTAVTLCASDPIVMYRPPNSLYR